MIRPSNAAARQLVYPSPRGPAREAQQDGCVCKCLRKWDIGCTTACIYIMSASNFTSADTAVPVPWLFTLNFASHAFRESQ